MLRSDLAEQYQVVNRGETRPFCDAGASQKLPEGTMWPLTLEMSFPKGSLQIGLPKLLAKLSDMLEFYHVRVACCDIL